MELINRMFDIVSGPNKDALFDSCKYFCNRNAAIPIEFGVAIGYTMPKGHPGCAYIPMHIKEIQICGITHENGSGESFNLQGYCLADLGSIGDKVNYTSYEFKAYYNSKTRKGTISFI